VDTHVHTLPIKPASDLGLMLCNARNLCLLRLRWLQCRMPQHVEQKEVKKRNSLA